MSKALTDNQISHTDFTVIMGKEKKYFELSFKDDKDSRK